MRFIIFLLLSTSAYSFINPDFIINYHTLKDRIYANHAFIDSYAKTIEGKEDFFASIGLVYSEVESRIITREKYNTLLPLVNLKYKNFYSIGGIQNGINVYNYKDFNFNTYIEYRFAGFETYDIDLTDRDDAIHAGIGLSKFWGPFFLSLGASGDISNTNNGFVYKASISSGMPIGNTLVLFMYNFNYFDSDYSNYYFGTELDGYSIDDYSHSSRFALAWAYGINEDIDIFTYVFHDSSSDNIKESPLVTPNGNSLLYGVGFTYTF